MNLEQFTYLVEVDKLQSITKAANQLYVSQSTISISIAHLEKELNMVLFKRSKIGTTTTANGTIIIEHAKKIIGELDAINNFAMCSSDNLESTVKIASAPLFSHSILVNMISDLLLAAPQLRIDIRESYCDQIIDDLFYGRIDLGIIGYFDYQRDDLFKTLKAKSINCQEMYCGQLHFYTRPKHPVLKKNHIEMQDLLQYPIISYKNLLIHLPDSLLVKTYLTELCNYETIKKMVANNDFIGLMPDVIEINDYYIKSKLIVRLESIHVGVSPYYGLIRLQRNAILPPEQKVIDLINQSILLLT